MPVSSLYPQTAFNRPIQGGYQQPPVPGVSLNMPLGMFQQSNELIGLHGLDSARQYPMKPNSTVPTFDLDSDHAFILSCDANGVTTIKILKFSVVSEEEYRKVTDSEKPIQIAKGDYDRLMERIEKLEEDAKNAKQFIRDGSNADATACPATRATVKPAVANDGAVVQERWQSTKHDAVYNLG